MNSDPRAVSISEDADADRFLSEASAVLSESLDYPQTFDRIARLSVPFLADWCAIDIAEENGDFQRVAVAHVEPEKASLARELQARFAPDKNLDVGHPKVLRTGESELWPEIPPKMLEDCARNGEHLDLMRELGFHSYMCVPLRARGRTLGAITFVVARSARRFTGASLALAEEIGRRAGTAFDNARLFRETETARRRAQLLAEASRLLAMADAPDEALEKIAQLSVPELGDWCAIRTLNDDGSMAGPFLAFSYPGMAALASMMRANHRPPKIAGRVLQTGTPELHPSIDGDEFLRENTLDEKHFQAVKAARLRSWLVVPIKLRDRTFGTLSMALSEPGRNYGPVDVSLAEDLAHRIALAIENARLHREAKRAIRARDELLSVASHEMRTPLAALQLMLRVLRNALDAGRPPEEVARELAGKIDTADRQVARFSKLVNSLLDLSRVKAGTALLEETDLDLGECVREVVARFEEERIESGSEIRIVADEKVVGHWDPFRAEQVVTNLVSNAIKYGRGEPIELSISSDGSVARLAVRDLGCGVGPEDRERIFERHFRAQKEQNGLGLGLYIVQRIVKEAGGSITLESEPSRGSTFTVSVPLDPSGPRAEQSISR